MARILLGWELGANRGHIIRLLAVADALSDEGHEVALALQDLSLMPPGRLASFMLHQAPLWPRLLASTARRYVQAAETMGDILHRIGLDDPATLPSLITGWHSIFAAFQPQLVIGDFSPAMGLAARGRVPVLHLGTGFSLPPADMDHFPTLSGREPVHDEAVTLQQSNSGLTAIGEAALTSLPAIFAADRQLPGEFARLDPYQAFRTGGYGPPSVAHPVPVLAAQPEGDPAARNEVFVYGFERAMTKQDLWQGLQLSRLKVRVHIPRLNSVTAKALSDRGFIVEPHPVPFADIARRSRIVISHGGHGFVCSAMLAGLPQIITHYDLEKCLTAKRVAGMGVGGHVALDNLKPQAFAQGVCQLYQADAPQQKARALASELASEMGTGPTTPVIQAAAELLE